MNVDKLYEVVVTVKKRALVCGADDESEAQLIALDALQLRDPDGIEVLPVRTESEYLAAAKRANVASQVSVLGSRVVVENAQ